VKSCSLAVHGEDLIFDVNSNRFLKGMVRTMVGTLVDVGRGKMEETEVMDVLEARDRRCSGLTAPAQGLCLVKVCYDSDTDISLQSDEREVPPT
jgi:tRNA pseudouridine38-40 synthase